MLTHENFSTLIASAVQPHAQCPVRNQAAIVTKWLKVGVDYARSLTKPRLPLTIALQQSLATTNGENDFLTHSKIYCGS